MNNFVFGTAIFAATFGIFGQPVDVRPNFLPKQDVVVVSADLDGSSSSKVTSFSVTKNTERDDFDHFALIINFTDHQTILLEMDRRLAQIAPAGAPFDLSYVVVPPPDANITPVGTKHIAGYSCTYWHIEFGPDNYFDCLTDNGINLLKVNNARGVEGMGYIATTVTLKPVDPAIFQIPADFHEAIFKSNGWVLVR